MFLKLHKILSPIKMSIFTMFCSATKLNIIFPLRANASLNLENQIKKVDDLVSGFEKKLSEDGPVPDVPNAIQDRLSDIEVSKYLLKILPLPQKMVLLKYAAAMCFKFHFFFVDIRASVSLWQQLRVT